VPPEHFTADAPLELRGVEYRASSRMTPVGRRLIHDEIRRQLGVRREIEAIVPEIRSPAFRLPSRASWIVSMDEIEDVAERLRDAWGLGAQPISNLTNLLEAHGVRVVWRGRWGRLGRGRCVRWWGMGGSRGRRPHR